MNQSDQICLPFRYNALCKTDIMESDKYTFVWRISQFSSRTEKYGEVLNSEEFTIKGPDDKITKWRVQLYPRGDKEGANDHVSLFLKKLTTEAEVNANYVLSYLDANKVKRKIKELGVTKFESGKITNWGWGEVIDRRDLYLYTPDDILTLILEITIMGKTKKSIEFTNSGEKYLALNENYHQKQLKRDFQTLFLSKDHADVIIRCGDKVFDCHKIILASRSQVFKTMLEADMKEKMSGEIEIKNMDHEVLDDLLKYIYSGVAPNIDAHSQKLFAAADQYQLEQLKELCELKLCSRFDVSNCIDLLILGDLYNAQKLKASALEFVSRNIHKMKISEWKQSLIPHPALMAEVMAMMMPKNANDDENDAAEIKKRAAS